MNNNGYIDSHLRALGFKCYDRKPVLSFLTATQAILASRIDPSKFCIPQKKKLIQTRYNGGLLLLSFMKELCEGSRPL